MSSSPITLAIQSDQTKTDSSSSSKQQKPLENRTTNGRTFSSSPRSSTQIDKTDSFFLETMKEFEENPIPSEEDNKKKEISAQALKTKEILTFISKLFDDFAAEKFFETTPTGNFLKAELKTSIEQLTKEFLSFAVPEQSSQKLSPKIFTKELFIIQTLSSIADFFEDFALAREKTLEKLTSQKIHDENLETQTGKDLFFKYLCTQRLSQHRCVPFFEETEAYDALSQDLLTLLRGCIDILQLHKEKTIHPETAELIVKCLGLPAILVLEELTKPERICLIIQHFLPKNTEKKSKNQMQTPSSLSYSIYHEQLTQPVQKLTQALINLSVSDGTFKMLLLKCTGLFSKNIAQLLWETIDTSNQSSVSVDSSIQTIKNFFYKSQESSPPQKKPSTLDSTEKDLQEHMSQIINGLFASTRNIGAGKASKICERMLKCFFFILKNPLLLQLLLHDILKGMPHALVQMIPPTVKKEASQIIIQSDIYTREVNVTITKKENPKKEVLKKEDQKNYINIHQYIGKWEKSYPSCNSLQRSEEEKRHLDFVEGLFTRILKDYVLPSLPLQGSILSFSQSYLLAMARAHLSSFIPSIVLKTPKDVSTSEKTILKHLIKGCSQFFQDYSAALPENKSNQDSKIISERICQFRQKRNQFSDFQNEEKTQKMLYGVVLGILDKLQKKFYPLAGSDPLRLEMMTCIQYFLAATVLTSINKCITSENVLTLINRVATEQIIWELEAKPIPVKWEKNETFHKEIEPTLQLLIESSIKLANIPLPKLTIPLAQNFTNKASQEILLFYTQLQLSPYCIKPYLIANFILFKKNHYEWLPALSSKKSTSLPPTKTIFLELQTKFELLLESEIKKLGTLAQLGSKAIRVNDFAKNFVEELFFFIQQPIHCKLLIVDLLTNLDEALNELLMTM